MCRASLCCDKSRSYDRDDLGNRSALAQGNLGIGDSLTYACLLGAQAERTVAARAHSDLEASRMRGLLVTIP